MRLDDTNPEVENQGYVDAIIDAVAWLGWRPDRITHSSDSFTERLILQGDAYVNNSTVDSIKQQRRELKPSPCRDRSKE